MAAAVDAPLITPVEAFKDNPVGKEPEVTENIFAPVPPVATTVAEYGVFCVSSGNEAVVIDTAGLIVTVYSLKASAPPSVHFILNVKTPVALGVPLITPVVEFKLSPVGNAPESIENVNGPALPKGTIVSE